MTFKRSNIEQQIQHMPKEVKWCKKCVNSNQRPRINFDEEGVCSGCRNTEYKNNEIPETNRAGGCLLPLKSQIDIHGVAVEPPSSTAPVSAVLTRAIIPVDCSISAGWNWR